MGPSGTEIDDGTPEDVAKLYAWANLTGARYRDFSAARREQRARVRLGRARESLEQERESDAGGTPAIGTESATRVALRAMEEEREIAEARASARRKEMAFGQAEQRRRERMGPQPGVERAEVRAVSRVGGAEYTSTGGAVERVLSAEEILVEEASAPIAEREPAGTIRPAWLEASAELPWPNEVSAPAIAAGSAARVTAPGATLLDSREQVAARWPVLRRLVAETHPVTARMSWPRGPVAAIVSPVSGSGNTSLAASMARALADAGERVLAVATDGGSLLPVYFGVNGLAMDEVRVATVRGAGGTITVMALGVADGDKRTRERAVDLLLERARGCDRIVVELARDEFWLVQSLAALRPMVLATMAPEVNSLAGLRAMEQTFAAMADGDGRPLLPFYLLNRFDWGLPLHLDMRELLRPALGERLLTTTVRRSAAVNEALAEGMTVLEYAPDAPIARDYADVAAWLRSVSPATAEAIAAAQEGR